MYTEFLIVMPVVHMSTLQSVFEQADHSVVSLATAVIGAYVSWIDISLIASDKCMRYVGC